MSRPPSQSTMRHLTVLCLLLIRPLDARAMVHPGSADPTSRSNSVGVVTRDNFFRQVQSLSARGVAAAAGGISVVGGGPAASASVPPSGGADGSNAALFDRSPCLASIEEELESKTVGWGIPLSSIGADETPPPVPWSDLRYGTSTLSERARVPKLAADVLPTGFPPWLEGTWSARMKFTGATFPQGRKILTLRVPGAGLGTCLSLPNVGYNPAPFPWKFLSTAKDRESGGGSGASYSYEDLAYNSPRRFEAFWPESKVESVRIGVDDAVLTPRCYVTGEGCSQNENPLLHRPSTRVSMEFSGPTRRGGRVTQSLDVSTVGSKSCLATADGGGIARFAVVRLYAQNNAEQQLQTFFKEIVSLTPVGGEGRDGDGGEVSGKMRVAAFLPRDGSAQQTSSSYDDGVAVALYDYKIFLTSITEEEASSM